MEQSSCSWHIGFSFSIGVDVIFTESQGGKQDMAIIIKSGLNVFDLRNEI